MMDTSKDRSALYFLFKHVIGYVHIILATLAALSLAAGVVLYLGQNLRQLVDLGFASSNASYLNQALLSLLLLVILLSLASFSRAYLSSLLGEKVSQDIKAKVFKHLLHLTPDFYQAHSTGALQSQLHSDTQLISVLLGGSASTGLRSVIQFAGAMIMLFISNLKLASLACLVMPLTLLPIVLFGRNVRSTARAAQDAESSCAGFTNEAISSVMTIQAFGRQEQTFTNYQKLNQSISSKINKRILAQSGLSTVVIFLVFSAVSCLMWYGGHEVISGKITAGQLVSFVFYAILAAGSINSMTQVYGDSQLALAACARLNEILQFKSNIYNPINICALPDKNSKIIFMDVDFQYPGNSTTVLSGFNLTIKRGETIALVGPSGAGKSTVLNLFMRFYDPSQGQILFGEHDLKELDLNALRTTIGWVPQDPVIFNCSVYDNIRYSNPEASNEKVEAAAKSAYALDFIQKLPAGFDTILGTDGSGLSSGQKQRIAIARAILKNPDIMLLDEATNSLDSESEYQVQKAIDHLMKGRTSLVVAHRLSTVLNADRILVLEHGKIIATGTHTTLVRQCPLYQRFVELQLSPEMATN